MRGRVRVLLTPMGDRIKYQVVGRVHCTRPGQGDNEEVRAGREEARLAFELGNAGRQRRLALGLTQADLAKRAGLAESALADMESGGPTPTIGVLHRLAHALGARLKVEFTDAA